MAKEEVKVDKIIRSFAKELEKEIPVKQIILFGSYADGKAKKDSDIDLIIVSPYFGKRKYILDMQYLFRKAADFDSHIEPIPATPEEIRSADKRTFLGQVKKTGKFYRI